MQSELPFREFQKATRKVNHILEDKSTKIRQMPRDQVRKNRNRSHPKLLAEQNLPDKNQRRSKKEKRRNLQNINWRYYHVCEDDHDEKANPS